MKQSMAGAALEYAAKGWRVFPLRPGEKTPCFKEWQIKATSDADQVRQWWERWRGANIGLATGDLIAVDLDVKRGIDGPENWEALAKKEGIDDIGALLNLTPSGGHHLVFSSNGATVRNSAGLLAAGIDVRGAGGYIVLPPSMVDGRTYDWDVSAHPDDMTPGPAPAALLSLLATVEKRKAAAGPVGAVIPETTRNVTLTKLAGVMRHRGMTEAAIEAALQVENANRCQPPLGESDVRKIAASIGKKEPAKERRKHVTGPEYVKALDNLGYTFRINDCADVLEVAGKAMTDDLRAKIRVRMRDTGFGRVGEFEDAYLANGRDNRYHPIKAYLTGLEHDGDPHIGGLTAHFQDRHDVFPVWFRRWLIGAVAKVMASEQNAMLVLDGRQNIGKSYFARWLASPFLAYFVEAPIDPRDKDNSIRLMSTMIWEVAELGSTTRRADREALKHFISQSTVRERRPYDKYDTIKPAMASLVGTINNECGFLTDPTGSRRFLVATLTEINWGYATEINIDQVWAEGMAAWKAGEPWQLTPDEAKMAAEINEGYQVEDPIENLLLEHFEIDPERPDWWMASADILGTLQDHGLRGNTRANQMGVSATMTRMGVHKYKFNGKNGYRGLRRGQSDDGGK